MSLNKYMHPRNRYKNTKPSFLQLALKYPDFRAMTTQDDNGKVFLDFKNADALRALTRCLLKEDFGLTVELPMNRLVPTLPLRLNYIHWLEDIIGPDAGKWGIDIGTGASCVYPLLASKMNQWNFLATETDAENFYHAQKNVKNNGFSHVIQVKKVSGESILTSSLESFSGTEKFDFSMCNPPFFADHMEAQGLSTTRTDDRPEAGSVSTASPQECIVAGGEIAFVRQMIEESTVLRGKIRVYTSMLGKKSSLSQLKEELRHQKVAKFSTTEFCQGKTMRWGIAWTYDTSVTFPRSQFEARKSKPPLQLVIPKGSGSVEYKVHSLALHLRQLLEKIKVHCYQGKQAKSYTSITLTAAENTWCHQRRLRRQQRRKNSGLAAEAQIQKHQSSNETEGSKASVCLGYNGHNDATCKSSPESHVNEVIESTSKRRELKGLEEKIDSIKTNTSHKRQLQLDDLSEGGCVTNKKIRTESEEGCAGPGNGEQQSTVNCESTKDREAGSEKDIAQPVEEFSTSFVANSSPKREISSCVETLSTELDCSKESNPDVKGEESQAFGSSEVSSDAVGSSSTEECRAPKHYILKCVMRLKGAGENINLELEWLDGQSRELMHQVFTFLKNKLSQL